MLNVYIYYNTTTHLTCIGFFTMRYQVSDLTLPLYTLYKTVDATCVHHASSTIQQIILPQALLTLSLLKPSYSSTINTTSSLPLSDSAPPSYTSSYTTVEDILEPLLLIYEYGESQVPTELKVVIESSLPSRILHSPFVLAGKDTIQILNTHQNKGHNYDFSLDKRIAGQTHVILESYEPYTGIRWCRTYFIDTQSTTTSNIECNTPLESKVNGGSDDVYIRGVYMSLSTYIDEAVRCVLGQSTTSVGQALAQIKVSELAILLYMM